MRNWNIAIKSKGEIMYKIEYKQKANVLKINFDNGWLPIGFFSIGNKNFNVERAYRFLNFEAEGQTQAEGQTLSFLDFKSVMENKASW